MDRIISTKKSVILQKYIYHDDVIMMYAKPRNEAFTVIQITKCN